MDKDMDKDKQASSAAGPARQSGDRPDPARRSLLKAAPLGALAVVAGRARAEAPPVPASAQPPAPRGYHETEHIRRYYRTAAYW